jgi:sugar lactone lactonase YvrE
MDEEDPFSRGALYRLDPNGNYREVISGVGISNGLGWSPDNRLMYYTDSRKRTIWVYDFDFESGAISNQQIFVTTPQEYIPDGLTVDAEGYVWSAKWDGWKVVRYAPDGSVDIEVELPVQRPTSCIFGGSDLTDIFITSASTGLSKSELAEQPLAGCVFIVDSGTKGLPEPRFAG